MALGGNRAVVLACIAGGAASLAASFIFDSGILAVASSGFFLLTLALWKYGYLIIPVATSGAKIIEVQGDIEIPPSGDLVLKRTPWGYCASSYVGLTLHDVPSGKTDSQKAVMMELFERALTSLRCTTKVSVLVANLDLSDYIDKLKSRRSLSETRLSQMPQGEQKKSDAARVGREIAHLTRQIERMSSGERPMHVVAYAMTTAEGATREEASARARSQASQVSAVLSGALGASASMLSGDDLRRCISWETSIPVNASKLSDELF